jgi:uncharacterized Zn-binding protein involved in type VI secretion
MKGVIRLGDPTSHGGKVVAASGSGDVMGPVARGGCVRLPEAGHSNCVIAEGDPAVLLDGVPVAFEGTGRVAGRR